MAEQKTALIVGGGPAGLFAAERISHAGFTTVIADRMPSVGRKFLVAGKGGLNLTNSADVANFVPLYATTLQPIYRPKLGPGSGDHWRKMLLDFTPMDLRNWAFDLGVPTFIGSSGRVFPDSKQAAPLLRRWIQRLRGQGVNFLVRHEFLDWEKSGIGKRIQATFDTQEGPQVIECDVLILAMGGASWPQTGSNAAWVDSLKQKLTIEPFVSSNCGYEFDWPEGFGEAFGGTPIKNISAFAGRRTVCGELLITRYGMEGTALYALGDPLRKIIQNGGKPRISINLKHGLEVKDLLGRLGALGKPKPGQLLDFATKAWKLGKGAKALLQTKITPETTPLELVNLTTRFQMVFNRARPIAESISSSGGVSWSEVSEGLELRQFPGVYCAGEMLDWDAPTGGYLMQGCFVTGARAARTAVVRLRRK